MNRVLLLCAGGILTFAFGSALPFLYSDIQADKFIARALESSTEKVFVTLVKAQVRSNLNHESFFYSVEFVRNGSLYRVAVPVDSEFYHLQKEGKNLEGFLYMTPAGQPYIRLEGNRATVEPLTELAYVSAALALVGVALITTGLLSRGARP